MDITNRQKKLWDDLKSLHESLRNHTYQKYNRINPFYEDLFDWKDRGSYWIGEDKNVTIYNSATISGKVSIGENTWIGPFCSLDGGEAGLTIGSFCSISAACHILTHDTVKWALSKGKAPYEHLPTSIGDGCFIGTGSIITKGVDLGERCLVAAGTVVTKSFESNKIIAGVPARIIGKVVVNGDRVEYEYL